MTFEVNLIFLIKPFFLHYQKVMTKTLISWEREELLKRNENRFPSLLKGFQWSKQHTIFFKRWKSNFKDGKSNFFDQYLLGKYPKLGVWREINNDLSSSYFIYICKISWVAGTGRCFGKKNCSKEFYKDA